MNNAEGVSCSFPSSDEATTAYPDSANIPMCDPTKKSLNGHALDATTKIQMVIYAPVQGGILNIRTTIGAG